MIVRFQTKPSNMEELVDRLGDIPLDRICIDPPPGTANETDLIHILDVTGRLYELVDGVIVEKPMASTDAMMSSYLLQLIGAFARENDLGLAFGGDGPVRVVAGNVRLPDVSFFPWSSLPGETFPTDKICPIAPALAIEVLSDSNTESEIARKRMELFLSGTKSVWIINPVKQSAEVFVAPDKIRCLGYDGVLEGGRILPGLKIPLADVFASVSRKKSRKK